MHFFSSDEIITATSYLLYHQGRAELCAAVQPEAPRGAVLPGEADLHGLDGGHGSLAPRSSGSSLFSHNAGDS